jgi:glycosyltransferase involved in cell wall biosynthesis
MPRLLRITTVPMSLSLLLQGQFSYMRANGFEVITMSADGQEVADVMKDGTQHTVIPLTRKITPLQDLKCLWLIIREIKKLRPDIVHTHTPKAGLLGMLASWICRVPVRLHTVAGLPLMEASGLKRFVLELTERVTYACAHAVYPNSFGLKAFIEEQFGLPPHKLKILGKGSSNGIDISFFERSLSLENQARKLRARYDIRENDVILSFVGRIVRDKGIVELVKAFNAILGDQSFMDKLSGKKLFLLLLGQFEEDLDPLPAPVMDFLRNDKRVILGGFQHDIRPWMMASDVFVFPSYREGFPNVVMQASLLRVPCIVSDINGCNEIVKNGRTGVVVPPKNAERLTSAMKLMIDDELKRKAFAAAARAFVADNFKRELIWEELRGEYERRLNAKGL